MTPEDLVIGQSYTLDQIKEMFPDCIIIDNSEGIIYDGTEESQ